MSANKEHPNSEQKRRPIKVPPIQPNPDMKPTTVNLDNLSARLNAKRKELFRRMREY